MIRQFFRKNPYSNSYWRVRVRVLNQWLRRQYLKVNRSQWQCLVDRKRYIVSGGFSDTGEVIPLSDIDRVELRYLNWQLGSGSVYRLTPEQEEVVRELARAVARECKKQ